MGPFNNETGRYLPEPGWEQGQWLSGEEGLFILPENGDQVEGPDGITADQLLRLWLVHGEIPPEAYQPLGLQDVPPVLRRFDPGVGYYSA